MIVERHEVLIVGAGNAGVSLAAKLLKDGARDVAVVDRRQVHRYRPLLNYVGSGEATMADLERAQHDVLPDGVTWIRDDVASVDPDARTVTTGDGRTIGYDTLVLCPGTPRGLGRRARPARGVRRRRGPARPSSTPARPRSGRRCAT